MVIRADARAMGAVTAHTPRGAARWTPSPVATRFNDTIIDGIAVPAAVVGSIVKVTYADGRPAEYKSASSFRQRSIAARATLHRQANQPTRITSADLAPIGNVE